MNKENEIAKMCPNNKLSKIIVTLGHNEVGKTNLIQRYTKKNFNEAYKETIGNFNKLFPKIKNNLFQVWMYFSRKLIVIPTQFS